MRNKKVIAVIGVTALAVATVLGACGKSRLISKDKGVTTTSEASGDASSSSSSSSEKDLEPSDSAKDAVGGFDDTSSSAGD